MLDSSAGKIRSNFAAAIMGTGSEEIAAIQKNAVGFINEKGFVHLFPEVSEINVKPFKDMKDLVQRFHDLNNF